MTRAVADSQERLVEQHRPSLLKVGEERTRTRARLDATRKHLETSIEASFSLC
jgi:hypothetical protein